MRQLKWTSEKTRDVAGYITRSRKKCETYLYRSVGITGTLDAVVRRSAPQVLGVDVHVGLHAGRLTRALPPPASVTGDNRKLGRRRRHLAGLPATLLPAQATTDVGKPETSGRKTSRSGAFVRDRSGKFGKSSHFDALLGEITSQQPDEVYNGSFFGLSSTKRATDISSPRD